MQEFICITTTFIDVHRFFFSPFSCNGRKERRMRHVQFPDGLTLNDFLMGTAMIKVPLLERIKLKIKRLQIK